MMGNSFDPYSGLLKGAWLTGPSEPDRTKLDPHTIFYVDPGIAKFGNSRP